MAHFFFFCAITELRAAIPIIIAAVAPEEDVNALPAYEDAWKSLPYDAAIIQSLIEAGSLPPSVAVAIPNEAASAARAAADNSSSGSSSHSGSGEEDNVCGPNDPLPWQGLDLSRVPSYTTAVRSGRLYSFSGSLPPYEAIIAVPGRLA